MIPDRSLLILCSGLFVLMTIFNSLVTYAPSHDRLFPSVIGGGAPIFLFGLLVVLFRTFLSSHSTGKWRYFLVHTLIVIVFGVASGLIHFASLPKLP